jgi:hypothetical protein
MAHRDLEYENLNTIYDCVHEENRIKCKNYELCKHTLSQDIDILIISKYLCEACGDWFKVGGFGWNELEFREGTDDCAVCCESDNKQVKFPANCGHWFCIGCSRNILFWDETRNHLSYVPYGCPPCPNGCINPIKGKQCYCYEYDETVERWRNEYSDKFEEHNEAEHKSIKLSETSPGSVFSSLKCPLCRKQYERV